MLPDGWFQVRGSNTEPVVRLVAEAKTPARVEEIASEVARHVEDSADPHVYALKKGPGPFP
jgi:phosphomannomutase